VSAVSKSRQRSLSIDAEHTASGLMYYLIMVNLGTVYCVTVQDAKSKTSNEELLVNSIQQAARGSPTRRCHI
jgi:hypothetical protein